MTPSLYRPDSVLAPEHRVHIPQHTPPIKPQGRVALLPEVIGRIDFVKSFDVKPPTEAELCGHTAGVLVKSSRTYVESRRCRCCMQWFVIASGTQKDCAWCKAPNWRNCAAQSLTSLPSSRPHER